MSIGDYVCSYGVRNCAACRPEYIPLKPEYVYEAEVQEKTQKYAMKNGRLWYVDKNNALDRLVEHVEIPRTARFVPVGMIRQKQTSDNRSRIYS